jgi:3-ketoacyl-CoA synthase
VGHAPPKDVYLVEYGCFRLKAFYCVPFATCLEHAQLMPYLVDKESASFVIRLLESSGLGEETCVLEAHHYMPLDRSLKASRDETEVVIFSTVDDAFARSGVKTDEINVIIVNYSIFTTMPVFSDMVVN